MTVNSTWKLIAHDMGVNSNQGERLSRRALR